MYEKTQRPTQLILTEKYNCKTMDEEIKDLELIERYVSGKLSKDELLAFESRLQEEREFESDYYAYQAIIAGVKEYGSNEDETKLVISQVHTKLQQEGFFRSIQTKSRFISRFMPYISTAAAITIAVLSVWFLLSRNTVSSNSDLFVEYYSPEANHLDELLDELTVFGMADPDATRREQLRVALEQYEAERYSLAFELFKEHANTYPDDKAGYFYQGLAALHQQEISTAITILNELLLDSTHDYELAVKWYLSLAYISLNTNEGNLMAIELLEEIRFSGSMELQNRALELLEKLRRKI